MKSCFIWVLFAISTCSSNIIYPLTSQLVEFVPDQSSLKKRHHALRTLPWDSLAKEVEENEEIPLFDEDTEELGALMINDHSTGHNVIDVAMESTSEDWSEIYGKMKEAYESGMKVLGATLANFEKDLEQLKNLSIHGNLSAPDYPSHFHALQMSVSCHTIQFLKVDSSFWCLLDEFAKNLRLEDTSHMSEKSKELLDEIYRYEKIIQMKITAAEAEDLNGSKEKNYTEVIKLEPSS